MKALTNTPKRQRSVPGRSVATAWILVVACLLFGAQLRASDNQTSSSSLRQDVESEFRIIPLRDGVLLEPREEIPDVAAIEVTEGNVAIDGESLSDDQVRDRLGEQRAELVLRLSALSDEERQMVLSDSDTGLTGSATSEAEESTAAPGAATPETPQPPKPPKPPRIRSDTKAVLGSSLHVQEGETVQDTVVMGGSLTVDGVVDGDAVVIGGPGTVNGEVMGDLVVIGGPAKLGPNAHIHGDVASVGGTLDRDPGAVVDGDVSETSLRLGGKWWSGLAHPPSHAITPMAPFRRITRVFYTVVKYLLIAVLAMLAMLIARRPMERTAARVVREPWKAGLVGLLAEILFFPVTILVVVLLAISIIGIPLLILVPFALLALAVGAFFGYCAVAWALGRWLRMRFEWPINDSYLQLLIGLGGLAVLTVVGRLLHIGPLTPFAVLMLIIGAILNYLAWTAGFGAVLMSRFGTSGPDTFPAAWVPAAADDSVAIGDDLPLRSSTAAAGESLVDDVEPESGNADEDSDRY